MEHISTDISTQEMRTVLARDTLYPHTVGILNPKFNCYMNALFACLYSIPFFQNSVYEAINEIPIEELPQKSESVLLSLGDLFAKMRLGSKSVNLKPTMFPAIKSAFGWKVGEYQCVLEFWTQFVEKMPESFNQIFKAKIKTNYHRKSDGMLVKSIPDEYCYINIPAPKVPINLAEIIDENFLDRETEDYGIVPADQHEYQHILNGPIHENVEIPVYSTVEFENSPNILAFGIKRLGWNREKNEPELNNTAVFFGAITVRGEIYRPCSYIIFDNSIAHYYALITDFKSNSYFIQNNRKLTKIDFVADPEEQAHWFDIIHKNSVMVFYVKVRAFHELRASGLGLKIKNDEDVSPVLLRERAELGLQAESKKHLPNKKKRRPKNSLKYSQSKKAKSVTTESGMGKAQAVLDDTENIFGATEDTEDVISGAEYVDTDSMSYIFSVPFEEDDDIQSIASDAVSWCFDEALFPDATEDNAKTLHSPSPVSDGKITSSRSLSPIIDDDWLDIIIATLDKQAVPETTQNMAEDAGNQVSDSQQYTPVWYTEFIHHKQLQQQIQYPMGQTASYDQISLSSSAVHGFANPYSQYSIHYLPQGYSGFALPLPPIPQQQFGAQTSQPPQSGAQLSQPPQFGAQTSPQREEFSISQLSPEEKKQLYILYETHSAKLSDKFYQLGTEEFSFSHDSRSVPLEMILTAFASNSSLLLSLFEIIKTNISKCEFEICLAVVLVQMLIGCKNININYIRRSIDSEFKIKLSERNINLSFETKIIYCLNFFKKKISNNLLNFPTVKAILYSELDTDEPIEISHSQPEIPFIDIRRTILTRPGNFEGVFFDSNKGGNRLKSIISAPTSSFFPIVTPRCDNMSEFITERFNPMSNDHVFLGCIMYGPRDNVLNYSAKFINTFAAQTVLSYNSLDGAKLTKYDSADYLVKIRSFVEEFRTNSYVTFAMKSSMIQNGPVKGSQIPPVMFEKVLKKIIFEFFATSLVKKQSTQMPDISDTNF